MVGGAPEFEGEMMDTRFKSAKVVLVKVRSELGAFAPPLRPPDPVGGTSGLHDGPLIGRTECLGRQANAASTSHGSRAIRAVSR